MVEILYVGNMPEDIDERDIYESFRLHITNSLNNKCHVQFTLSENTAKWRGFPYLTLSKHAINKFLKLDGLEFKKKSLIIEKSKSPPKPKVINEINKQIFSQMQSLILNFKTEYIKE